MLKIFYFFGVLLGFFFSPFDGGLFAVSASASDGLFLEENMDSVAQNLTEEDFLDPLWVARAKKDPVEYILYARPGGALGDQLRNFWNDVRKAKLDNPPVQDYPPHITLTGFFQTKLSEKKLISSLQGALKSLPIIPIVIQGKSILFYKPKDIDYIGFQDPNSALHAVTLEFLAGINEKASLARPTPKSPLGYHLTLRQETSGDTTKKVEKLENKDINLAAPNLQKNTTWSLYIYKRTGKKLEKIYQQSIATQ